MNRQNALSVAAIAIAMIALLQINRATPDSRKSTPEQVESQKPPTATDLRIRFDRLRIGMSYETVSGYLGSPGILIPNPNESDLVYVWSQSATVKLLAAFRDQTLVDKSVLDLAATSQPGQPTRTPPPQSYSPAPQSQTVYVTASGGKYHRAGCRYLSKSKTAMSLDDANARGYSPCSVCKP